MTDERGIAQRQGKNKLELTTISTYAILMIVKWGWNDDQTSWPNEHWIWTKHNNYSGYTPLFDVEKMLNSPIQRGAVTKCKDQSLSVTTNQPQGLFFGGLVLQFFLSEIKNKSGELFKGTITHSSRRHEFILIFDEMGNQPARNALLRQTAKGSTKRLLLKYSQEIDTEVRQERADTQDRSLKRKKIRKGQISFGSEN